MLTGRPTHGRGNEADELVHNKNHECIGDDEEALEEVYTKEKQSQQSHECCPPSGHVRHAGVKPMTNTALKGGPEQLKLARWCVLCTCLHHFAWNCSAMCTATVTARLLRNLVNDRRLGVTNDCCLLLAHEKFVNCFGSV